jgi:VWFA-related protein
MLCGLSAVASAQQPPAPAFKTGVDLLTAEASIFDKDGHPITDLQAADFTARVDGRPRAVVFARFFGSTRREAPAGATSPPTSSAFVSNAAVEAGRVVVLAIDLQSVRAGEEKPALETAAKFVDALAPQDAVGLLGFPGVAVNVTRDHAKVRDAIRRIVGAQPRADWSYYVTLDEAEKITRGDRITRARVLDRECPFGGSSCAQDITTQARELVGLADAKIQASLMALGGLVDRLKVVRGPKHLVLISGGLPIGMESLGLYQDFARRAAAAQVTLYAIHLDQSDMEASPSTKRTFSPFGGRELTEGLANMASMTGGVFYSGVARATGVFARIETDINNYYELGIESAPGDADGKTHALELKVDRPGVTLRSRREVIAPARAAPSSADAFLELLYQPIEVTDLPIGVATYAMRGDQPDMLTVFISAEIGGGATLRGPVQWGFTIVAADKVVSSHRQSAEPVAGAPLVDTVSAKLEPGRYQLHVAALDADGRAGSFEVPVAVGLRAVGDFQMSDLIVGELVDHLQPRARIPRRGGIVAAAELYADDPNQFADVDAVLQFFADGSSQPAVSSPMQLKPGGSAGVRFAQGTLNAAGLPPGRYTVSAVVRMRGRPVGKVSRAVEITQ